MRLHTKWTLAALILLVAAAPAGWMAASEIREARTRKLHAKVWTQYRAIAHDFLSYGIDRCGVFAPPDTWHRRQQGEDIQQTFETDVAFITTFVLLGMKEPITHWFPITTPVAYMKSLPMDPFRRGKPIDYKLLEIPYISMPDSGIVRSVGPNRRPDLDIDEFYRWFSIHRAELADEQGRTDPYDFFDPIRERLIPHLYDPTNGTFSDGDIIGLKLSGAEVHFHNWLQKEVRNPPPLAPPPVRTGPMENVPPATPAPALFAARLNALWTDLAARGEETDDPVAYARNQLRFRRFFTEPALLNDGQQVILREAKSARPLWWQFVEDPGLLPLETAPGDSPVGEIPSALLIDLAPLIGKSLLLLAAEHAANGERTAAEQKLRELTAFTALLHEQNDFHAHVKRTLDEMGDALARAIADHFDSAPPPELATTSSHAAG